MFGKDESVVCINRIGRNLDLVSVTLFQMRGLLTEPLISDNPAFDDRNGAMILHFESFQEHFGCSLTFGHTWQILQTRTPNRTICSRQSRAKVWDARILQEMKAVDIHWLERNPLKQVSHRNK